MSKIDLHKNSPASDSLLDYSYGDDLLRKASKALKDNIQQYINNCRINDQKRSKLEVELREKFYNQLASSQLIIASRIILSYRLKSPTVAPEVITVARIIESIYLGRNLNHPGIVESLFAELTLVNIEPKKILALIGILHYNFAQNEDNFDAQNYYVLNPITIGLTLAGANCHETDLARNFMLDEINTSEMTQIWDNKALELLIKDLKLNNI